MSGLQFVPDALRMFWLRPLFGHACRWDCCAVFWFWLEALGASYRMRSLSLSVKMSGLGAILRFFSDFVVLTVVSGLRKDVVWYRGFSCFLFLLLLFGFWLRAGALCFPIVALGTVPVFVRYLVRWCVFPSLPLLGSGRFLLPWFVSRLL